MNEPTPSLRPDQLTEKDFEALKEDLRGQRKHRLGWLLLGITDSAATGLVLALALLLYSLCLSGAFAFAKRGIDAILAAALVPLAVYALVSLPTWTGKVDMGRSRHPHLYPSLLLVALAAATLTYWGFLLTIT